MTFSCYTGFTYFGPDSLQCLDGGIWNDTVGTCKKGTLTALHSESDPNAHDIKLK